MELPSERHAPGARKHYDAAYFAWQGEIGRFAAKANRFKFERFIRSSDRVLDFGCGGGFLVAGLSCAERMGIEVNPSAREEAAKNGVVAVASTDEVPDNWANVIISNSCLEHCEAPLWELRRLLPKLKTGGRLVLVVPHETIQWGYARNDINQHLYTWSPMALGNLVEKAGYRVDSVSASLLVWPPRVYQFIAALCGHAGLRFASRAYRALRSVLSPIIPLDADGAVIVVAMRPHHHELA